MNIENENSLPRTNENATSAGARLPGTPEPMHTWQGHGGIRLAGDSWGTPEHPLVILLHGGGQTRHAWRDTGALLAAAGYYVVAFDARGHGDSEWSVDVAYSQDAMAKDLRCVVDQLGKTGPALVGASMGGGVAMVAIGDGYVDASALILVDIGPMIESEGVDKIRAFMGQSPEGFRALEDVADAIRKYQPQREKQKTFDGLAKNVRLGSDGRYHWHWDPRYLAAQVNLPQRETRLIACSRRLTLPVLLVRGGLSDVLSVAGAQAFLELCKHSEYVNVTDAGHMVAGDRNDAFSSAIIDFLCRVVPAKDVPLQPQRADARSGDTGPDGVDVP